MLMTLTSPNQAILSSRPEVVGLRQNLSVWSWIGRIFCAALMGFAGVAAAAAPFDCKTNHCGILHDAPYPNFVIGIVDGVATPGQTAVILSDAQRAGAWHLFPPSPAAFSAKIEPISINFAPGRSITVLSAAWETQILRLSPGELIRFAPHRGLHEKPRPHDPYWVGVGCVALLCAAGDTACERGYRPGLYRISDGALLDSTGKLVPGGIRIDTISMRPELK
jgi:hypothetical protein